MLTTETILIRILLAVILGAIIGFERELVGKDAGIRTNILVVAGASIFTMIGLLLPYIGAYSSTDVEHIKAIVETSRGFSVIASIVSGIGFLGAGVILKNEYEITGVTTAASIWFAAAVGILTGLGLIEIAAVASIGVVVILITLRKIDMYRILKKEELKQKYKDEEI